MGAYHKKQAEFVVVGSGPGGATVARELAKAGKQVLLLERGHDHRGKWYYGTHLGAMIYCDKRGLRFANEGLQIIQGIMTGGSTNLFCASAAEPPEWLKRKYRISLDTHVRKTVEELNIAPLPRPLWGRATQRIEEAAADLGYTWAPQPKFMNVTSGEPFDCGAKCMLGCRCGAKWTANEYVDEAVRNNCELITGAQAKEVFVQDGAAAGVLATLSGGSEVMRIEAKTVVLAAGGIGTPIILQHSGLPEAGQGMTMDTTVMVYGESREEGMYADPPMAVSWTDEKNGYMLSTLIDPWLSHSMILSLKGPRNPIRFLRYGRTMGLMIKLKDDLSGGVSMEGRVSKPLTDQDRWRLNHASNLCRRILIQAGCRPDSIFVGPLRGSHPSGTVRIRHLLTTQLETPISNLYVSDASCFPEALGQPTSLTLIALAKRLAQHLLNKDNPKAKPRTKAKAKAKQKPKGKKTPSEKTKKAGDGPAPTPGPEPEPST